MKERAEALSIYFMYYAFPRFLKNSRSSSSSTAAEVLAASLMDGAGVSFLGVESELISNSPYVSSSAEAAADQRIPASLPLIPSTLTIFALRSSYVLKFLGSITSCRECDLLQTASIFSSSSKSGADESNSDLS